MWEESARTFRGVIHVFDIRAIGLIGVIVVGVVEAIILITN
jgi:hypothetical protein